MDYDELKDAILRLLEEENRSMTTQRLQSKLPKDIKLRQIQGALHYLRANERVEEVGNTSPRHWRINQAYTVNHQINQLWRKTHERT